MKNGAIFCVTEYASSPLQGDEYLLLVKLEPGVYYVEIRYNDSIITVRKFMLIINLLILKQMRMFRFLLPFLLGLVLIGCNNDDSLLTSKKQGLKSQSDFDPKNKVGYVLNAEEIEEVALAIPLEFSSSAATKAGLVSKKVKETILYSTTKWGKSDNVTKSTSDNDDIYIVNYEDNAGFVVLSASDCVNRVLAYSDNGNLTEDVEVPGVQMFMAALADYDGSVITDLHPYPTDSIDEEGYYYCNPQYYWGYAEVTVGPLLTAQWGQRYPYNSECPIVDGTQCPAGCVAVALGQIMSVHQYPTSIYSEAYSSTLSLNWANLSTKFTSLTTDAKAVAALLREIGRQTDMNYQPSGSGSNIYNAYSALQNMGYTSASVNSYNETLIKQSLSNGRPLYIRGVDEANGGHAWVLMGSKELKYTYMCDWDVYDSNNNYVGVWSTIVNPHLNDGEILSTSWNFNWGWNGSYDGYYNAGVYNPSNYDFSNSVQIIPEIRRSAN